LELETVFQQRIQFAFPVSSYAKDFTYVSLTFLSKEKSHSLPPKNAAANMSAATIHPSLPALKKKRIIRKREVYQHLLSDALIFIRKRRGAQPTAAATGGVPTAKCAGAEDALKRAPNKTKRGETLAIIGHTCQAFLP